jgi:Domain of unknown function (DUF4192)
MTKRNQTGDSSPRAPRQPQGSKPPHSPADPQHHAASVKTGTATAAGRPTGAAGRARLRAATPDAVLAVVPHMLGFYPSRSLVVLGLGEQHRVMVTFRYDLPEPDDHELAADIAQHAQYVLSRERISSALLIGYGPEQVVLPVLALAAAKLGSHGIDIQEALRAEGGRYWSLLCDDPSCCPPEGRSYDPGSHPAAAAMTQAGLGAHPDREALARTLQRPAGTSDVIAHATRQARIRLIRISHEADADGARDPVLRATRIGRREVQRAIRLYRSGGTIRSIGQLAWLAVLLGDIRVRDDAWARMDPAHRDDHCRLWTDVVRGAATDCVPAPASLLAFTAWQAGNGALASVAVDRALAADPRYSMALLIGSATQAALPPAAARMPMTPAAVAASYAAPPGRDARSRRVPRRRPSRSARKAEADSRSRSTAGRTGKRTASGR